MDRHGSVPYREQDRIFWIPLKADPMGTDPSDPFLYKRIAIVSISYPKGTDLWVRIFFPRVNGDLGVALKLFYLRRHISYLEVHVD